MLGTLFMWWRGNTNYVVKMDAVVFFAILLRADGIEKREMLSDTRLGRTAYMYILV